MTMHADFRALLLADGAVASLTGGRIYWGEAPQGAAYPNVTLNRVSLVVDQTYGDEVALRQTRVQVDCWGDAYGDAAACSDAILARCQGLALTVGSTRFQGVFLDGLRDGRADGLGDDSGVFRVSADYMLKHEEI